MTGARAADGGRHGIGQYHGVPVYGGHLRDPRAHGAGADDTDHRHHVTRLRGAHHLP